MVKGRGSRGALVAATAVAVSLLAVSGAQAAVPTPVVASPPTFSPTSGLAPGSVLTVTSNGGWTNGPTNFTPQWVACTSQTLLATCSDLGAVPNGGFEAGTDPWTGYACTSTCPPMPVSTVGSPVHSGAKALVVSTQAGTIGGFDLQADSEIFVNGGRSYTFSLWVYSPVARTYRIGWDESDLGNSWLGARTGTVTVPAATWTFVRLSAVTRTKTRRVNPYFDNYPGTTHPAITFYADDAYLSTGTTYTVQQADGGKWIRLRVVASNADGAGVAYSASAQVQGAGPANTAPPAISGTPQQGQTLTTTDGTWTNNPTAFSYQWLACNNNVAADGCVNTGADQNSYTLVAGDLGKRIRVRVTASNAQGSGQATSDATPAVTAPLVAPSNVTLPAITGASVEGSTVTSSTGTWLNDPTAYTYEWWRCAADGTGCGPIGLPTSSNQYVLQSADVGHKLKVRVRATNAAGSNAVDSAFFPSGAGTVTAAVGPSNTSPPTISGSVQVGAQLTANPGTWAGSQPITFTYQWVRCNSSDVCTDINLATAQTYTIAPTDLGYKLKVQVAAHNVVGVAALYSGTVGPVVSGNMLGNPDFETTISPWVGYAASLSRTSAFHHGGSWALQVTTQKSKVGGFWLQPYGAEIPVNGSTPYTFSLWVYSTAAGPYRIAWDEDDANLNWLGNRSMIVNLPANTWTQVTMTKTTRAATRFVNPYFDNDPWATHPVVTFYADDLSLQP